MVYISCSHYSYIGANEISLMEFLDHLRSYIINILPNPQNRLRDKVVSETSVMDSL